MCYQCLICPNYTLSCNWVPGLPCNLFVSSTEDSNG